MPLREYWLEPFLIERHTDACPCSYCTDHGDPGDIVIKKLHFGLNLPINKGRTSWRVFKIGRWYIRWTAFWKPRHKPFLVAATNKDGQ